MTKDEALDLALEALEALGASCLIVRDDMLADKIQQAITALREELAQPEQKPYGWIDVYGHFWNHKTSEDDVPLYTTPPQRKPLTDKQILADETLRYYFGQNGGAGPVSKQGRKVVNAIEALHEIKENT